MVVAVGQWPIDVLALVLAQATITEKLPPPTRAAVLMALLGIVLLGMLIVAFILLGGHWVRRQGSVRRGPAAPPDRAPLKRNSSAAEVHETPATSSRDGDLGDGEPRNPRTDYGETRFS